MKKFTHIKLGREVLDEATQLLGMLTHLCIEIGYTQYYFFQPAGLNPETGQPIKGFWLVAGRVGGDDLYTETELPVEVLGTKVKDKASGFSGMAIALHLHINGCVHLAVKPPGKLAKTGETVAAQDFDIRRLTGPAVPVLTEDEKESSQKKNPSPVGVPAPRAM